MNEILLLVNGASIALISSIVTAIIQHFLRLKGDKKTVYNQTRMVKINVI